MKRQFCFAMDIQGLAKHLSGNKDLGKEKALIILYIETDCI